MKRTLLISCVLFISKLSFAQWTTSGNDIYNSNGGKVGIGTNSPGFTLDVAGPVRLGGSGAYTNILLGTDTTPFGSYNQTSYLISPTIPGSGTARTAFRFKSNIEPPHGSNLLDVIVDGNVGIGTTSPGAKLHISDGGILLEDGYALRSNSSLGASLISCSSTGQIVLGSGQTEDWLKFNSGGIERMRISADGNVGIGTANPTQKLSVNGNIRAKEIKVEIANWPDYVFEEEYRLEKLDKLEGFIKDNKHLPEIPSAAEVKHEGINLGEMNAKLLKKIEELTLYIIEMKKSDDRRDVVVTRLQQEIDKLQSKP